MASHPELTSWIQLALEWAVLLAGAQGNGRAFVSRNSLSQWMKDSWEGGQDPVPNDSRNF